MLTCTVSLESNFGRAGLPMGHTVREHVPHDEMHEIGRDIFHCWVKKVNAAVPQTISMGTDGQPDLLDHVA